MNEITKFDIKDIINSKDQKEFLSLYFNPLRGIINVKDNQVISIYNTDDGPAYRLHYLLHSDIPPTNIIGEDKIDKRYAKFNPLAVYLYLERCKDKYIPEKYNYYGEEAYANVRFIKGKNKTIIVVASIKSLDISSNIKYFFNQLMPLFQHMLPEDKIDVYLLKSNQDDSDFDFLKLEENNEEDFLGERYKLEEVAKDAGCSVDSLQYDKNFVNLVN